MIRKGATFSLRASSIRVSETQSPAPALEPGFFAQATDKWRVARREVPFMPDLGLIRGRRSALEPVAAAIDGDDLA